MASLLGAWSLDGRPVVDHADALLRRRLASSLLGSEKVDEFMQGRLWLRAERGLLAHDAAQGVLAGEGLIARGDAPLVSLLGAAPPQPEGHFVLVHCADVARGPLTLARSISGGEHLYTALIGGCAFFASSLRALRAHPAVGTQLVPRVVSESLLVGLPVFGQQTPLAGLEEVLPGHTQQFGGTAGEQRFTDATALDSPRGRPEDLARAFRFALCEAIEAALGRQRPLVVALSGGIDSAAIAAAAVEVAGAANVVALTYEFAEQGRLQETDYARAVCAKLGIRDHRIFSIDGDDFLEALPECVWRAESAVHWPKAFLLPVARKVRALGFDSLLTGFGIGSHMGPLRELGRMLPWLPAPVWARLWRLAIYERRHLFDRLSALHPGLEVPHPRLIYLLLRLLEDEGRLPDVRAGLPAAVAPLLHDRPRGRSLRRMVGALRPPSASFARRAQLAALAHLVSCVDVTRSDKSSRELGVQRIAPAHFRRCIPYAYFPVDPAPPLFSAARRQRPGKWLLQLAYRGVLPDNVLFRVKNWADAVASPSWLRAGRVQMLRTLPRFSDDLRALRSGDPDFAEAALHWEPRSILAAGLSFLFWKRLLVDRDPSLATPPTWDELLAKQP